MGKAREEAEGDAGGGGTVPGGRRAGDASGDVRGGGRETGPGSAGRRRAVAVAWVCSVAAAAVLGAWSFAHADPGDQYERPEPLSDAGVRHELAQERAAASASPSPTDPSSTGSSPSASGAGTPSAGASTGPSASATAPPSGGAGTRTATVRLPKSLGAATAACHGGGDVRLLSWSPAEGYSVDDVERGPAGRAVLELEPVSDDGDDVDIAVRCDASGRPHASVLPDEDDD